MAGAVRSPVYGCACDWLRLPKGGRGWAALAPGVQRLLGSGEAAPLEKAR